MEAVPDMDALLDEMEEENISIYACNNTDMKSAVHNGNGVEIVRWPSATELLSDEPISVPVMLDPCKVSPTPSSCPSIPEGHDNESRRRSVESHEDRELVYLVGDLPRVSTAEYPQVQGGMNGTDAALKEVKAISIRLTSVTPPPPAVKIPSRLEEAKESVVERVEAPIEANSNEEYDEVLAYLKEFDDKKTPLQVDMTQEVTKPAINVQPEVEVSEVRVSSQTSVPENPTEPDDEELPSVCNVDVSSEGSSASCDQVTVIEVLPEVPEIDVKLVEVPMQRLTVDEEVQNSKDMKEEELCPTQDDASVVEESRCGDEAETSMEDVPLDAESVEDMKYSTEASGATSAVEFEDSDGDVTSSTEKASEIQQNLDESDSHEIAVVDVENSEEATSESLETTMASPSSFEVSVVDVEEEETEGDRSGSSHRTPETKNPTIKYRWVKQDVEEDEGETEHEGLQSPRRHGRLSEESHDDATEVDGEEEEGEEDDEELERKESTASTDSNGLVTAIECATPVSEDLIDQIISSSRSNSPAMSPAQQRASQFQSIATVHDLSVESDNNRLTESELQLGKCKPYWIPDKDTVACMLCSLKFTLLVRRHHCRACGRVLCTSCCCDKARLRYMDAEEPTKAPTKHRVCTPCAVMLDRIEKYEAERLAETENETIEDESGDQPSSSSAVRVPKAVARSSLKNRTASTCEDGEAVAGDSAERKRSVMFRDGVPPGGTAADGSAEEERSTTIKPRKKNRKRPSVARRIAELKFDEELQSALPNEERVNFLVQSPNGDVTWYDNDMIVERLRHGRITFVLRKNLYCVVQVGRVSGNLVWCVSSRGFASVGMDEIFLAWNCDNPADFTLPTAALHRISKIYVTVMMPINNVGVRQTDQRMPCILSNDDEISAALPQHILLFRAAEQDFHGMPTPPNIFLVGCFLHDSELAWAMACPNRLLFRLGLKYGWYPTPIINTLGRDSIVSETEATVSVIKVFTDFRNWDFRLPFISGSTVTLSNDNTTIMIPYSAIGQIKKLISWNKSMLAWQCDANLMADSHLVVKEENGMFSTQVLAKGNNRTITGATFVIFDAGLKVPNQKLQVSVVEDGVAIRIHAEQLDQIIEAFNKGNDYRLVDANMQLSVLWVDGDNTVGSVYEPVSPIDGANLSRKWQYGLSMERVITDIHQMPSMPDYGIRLSHMYNLQSGRLTPDVEPKVFNLAEAISRGCIVKLDPYFPQLVNMGIDSLTMRIRASSEEIEYEVAPWVGMEEEQSDFKQNYADLIIPALDSIVSNQLIGGVHMELTISFVSTKPLPL